MVFHVKSGQCALLVKFDQKVKIIGLVSEDISELSSEILNLNVIY